MQSCEICGKSYVRGTMVDVGVGFMQVSADEPACDCEYEAWLKEENKMQDCENCTVTFDPEDSSADLNERFCSSECEEEYNDC